MIKMIIGVLLFGMTAMAHVPALENFKTKPILADLNDLKSLGIPVLAKDEVSQVGFAVVTPLMQQQLQAHSHQVGKCAGFESLPERAEANITYYLEQMKSLNERVQKDQAMSLAPMAAPIVIKSVEVEKAIQELSITNLQNDVKWLSSFPNRYNKASDPNRHVQEMKLKIEQILKNSKLPATVSLIDHNQTKQKSIRVHIEGSVRPNEIIVLGGHLDSINQSWFGSDTAPGADDNASGSSNLLDVLRVISQKAQPQRSLEFFWYAGEESGLLGSAEIAQTYKSANKNVIAVLQLDMTLYPGAGEMVLGSMTDFTSPWLRNYLKEVNNTYLHIQIAEDKCGYGCSDHASWYRQGYPTLMPFEATMHNMNGQIHTENDTVTPSLSFDHSMIYSKIALVFAMDLANSEQKQLY